MFSRITRAAVFTCITGFNAANFQVLRKPQAECPLDESMACLFAARIVVWFVDATSVYHGVCFLGVNTARVGARQPVFHLAYRHRAHRGADCVDDAPGLDWYPSKRKPAVQSLFRADLTSKQVKTDRDDLEHATHQKTIATAPIVLHSHPTKFRHIMGVPLCFCWLAVRFDGVFGQQNELKRPSLKKV
jgi:hypothetical protein